MKKLRVLLLTRNLPPLLGGMENLNFNLAQGLGEYCELAIVGPKASTKMFDSPIEIAGSTLKPLWRFLIESMVLGVKLAMRCKPDVVVGGSGLMAPAVLLAARMCGAKSVLYVHGLDLAVQHFIYQRCWGAAIRRVDLVVSNSQPTSLLAQRLGVDKAKTHVVCPGVDTETVPVDPESVVSFRKKFGFEQRPLLLSVGRLTARKGLREFVESVLPKVVSRTPDVLLVVIGDAPDDALHALPQRKEDILACAQSVGIAGNVLFLGRVADADLRCAYQASSVHVFPVREIPGDPEGFGMVAIEAAVHGVPTVAFRSGGVTDSVGEGRSGFLVEPEDYAQFAERVCEVLATPGALRESSIDFARQFGWPIFNAQIRLCLEQLCGRAQGDSSHTPPAAHP